jgi:SNF2 family DNA or RNA helicase
MISAGNIRGAIEYLGGTQTNGNLIDLVIKKQRNKLEDAKRMAKMYEDRIVDRTRADKSTLESLEMWSKRIREYETNIEEIKNKYEQILKEDCVVCADTLRSPVMVPCCQHIFCGACVIDWVRAKGTCITCRTPLSLNMLVYVNETESEERIATSVQREERPKTKQEMIVTLIKDIVEKNSDAKIIVFSEYDETFTMIKEVLAQSNLSFKECKGNVKTREKVLRNFRIGNVPILFLNAQYNGAGINLQETTDIILYHEMSETVRMQIVGRANRLGRVGELHVHTLTS